MNAALPSNFKLASETKVVIHPDYDPALDEITEKERLIVAIVEERQSIDLKELAEITELKYIQPIIKTLIEKELLLPKKKLTNATLPKQLLVCS